MYALHDLAAAVTALPTPAYAGQTPGQVEPRAVESTEQGRLESEGRDEMVSDSGSPVVRLIQDSVRGMAEMVASSDQKDAGAASTSGAYLGNDVGGGVDLYA